MINPERELFRWGPIDGKPVYVYFGFRAFGLYPKFIDGTLPDVLSFVKDDRVIGIADYANLRNNGEILFRKYVMDGKKLKGCYDRWLRTANKIRKFEEKVNKGISGLSDDKLKELFIAWEKAYVDFWLEGFLPELSNWGGEQLLKKEILRFNRLNFIEIFEGLSAPEDISFFQKEELEFMKIRIMDNKEEQSKRLSRHQKEYYWLRNSYGFTNVLDISFFRDELEKISLQDAEKKISEINSYACRVKQKKHEIIRKYKIDKEVADIAEKLAFCVWWQDFRKQFIFIANHIITKFVEEIGKRKGIPFREICYYLPDELIELMEKGTKRDAKQRFKGFVLYYHEKNSVTYLAGREADDFARPYTHVEIDPDTKEFKGIVVSRGKKNIVRGRVNILLSPQNISRMQQGGILVAPMTSPDYVIAMRKAKAVITDEGGMTSHAAIVSREIGVPCIVGTRIATRLLRDGDLVEVDADKGIVRKIG